LGPPPPPPPPLHVASNNHATPTAPQNPKSIARSPLPAPPLDASKPNCCPMAQPEDAAAQALRLAAHALQHISLQSSSSSSSDEEHDAAESAPLAAAAPAAAVDEPSPLASPKLAHKLLSSVAHVRLLAMHVCRMILISGLGYGFNLRDNVSGGIGCSQRCCCHWSAHAQRRCSSWPTHAQR
jgi:hypothetical protein